MQVQASTIKTMPLGTNQLIDDQGRSSPKQAIEPMKLALLNYGLFKQLRKLGTSKIRICQALSLSSDDYDHIVKLG